MFSKETYIQRRRALLERMKGESGIAIFIGNVDSPAQYRDNCYKWRQDSNFLYFFGIDAPRFAASIDLESGEEIIYADDFELDDIIWMGPMESVASQAAGVGVSRSERYDKLTWTVTEAMMKRRRIHFLPASREYNAVIIASLVGLEPAEIYSIGKKGCPKASKALVRAVAAMRLVKSPEEIARIDEACVLGQQMHTIARRGIRPGRLEQEIVGEMEAVALGKGWGVSFPTILTQHGEIFHCHFHALPVEPGKLMVIDAGLESNENYASDFTRTYPTSGVYTPRQREIYQLVVDCNDLAFSLIRPGVRYVDVHKAAARRMLEGLAGAGLVSGDPAEMAELGVAGLFMPHGLGHNMGLDVHDCEDLGEDIVGYDDDQTRSDQLGLGSLRMARTLVPGNVITDEPGIYFIPALIEQWKSEGKFAGMINYSRLEDYYSFGGIRVEDDVLVTADGARRLGGERLPASADEVEEAMARDKEMN